MELACIDPATLSAAQRYRLMIGVLVPRPIAWVTSCSAAGVVNLAPFSFYAGISASPPLLGLGVGRRRDGSRKDTARNILNAGEFVVHLVEEDQLVTMVASSAELPSDRSEADELGLELAHSERVAVPGLACARVRMECVLHRHLALGDAPTDFLIGEVLAFRVLEQLLDAERHIREEELRPVGRLGGSSYAPIGARLQVARPGASG